MSTQTHMGLTISVNRDMQFVVTGPGVEPGDFKPYNTFREAKEAIEANAKRKKITLSLPVITDRGEDGEITGINRTSSDLMGRNVSAGHFGQPQRNIVVYPPAEWIREDLARLTEIDEERGEIADRLQKVAIRVGRGYGRLDIRHYPQSIERLQRQYDEVVKGAKKGRPSGN